MTLQALKRAVIETPDDAQARFALAEAFFAQGDWSLAERQLAKALELSPLHANAQRLLAKVYEATGRLATDADRLPQSDRERATRAAAEHRLDDAIVYGQRAATEAATDAGLWAQVAEWCRQKQLFDRAKVALGHALRISQSHATFVEARDALLEQLGEADSLDLVSESVGQGESLQAVASAFLRGDVAGMKRALVTASPRERALGHAERWLGELKLASRDHASAAKHFEAARAKDPRPYAEGRRATRLAFDEPGRVGVLGWSPVGGAVSPMEAVAVPGRGVLQFTGNVGETGKEAGLVAFTCLKAMSPGLGIEGLITAFDLHFHFTDIEFGKEGLSSGLALTLAGLSAFRRRPLVPRLAATGAITLHGEVQRVEGIYEKFVAAVLAGTRRVLYPRGNAADVSALPSFVGEALELVAVGSLEEALKHAGFD